MLTLTQGKCYQFFDWRWIKSQRSKSYA